MSQAELCFAYDKAAIGTFKVIASDNQVTKVLFIPEKVIRGTLEEPLELYAEKDACAFYPREDRASFILLNGSARRISVCNAGHIRDEMVHVPYVYTLANC